MKIKVTDNKVEIRWLGKTEISDVDIIVDMYKNANEQERRRLTVNLFDTSLFRIIEEVKPRCGSRRLPQNNCDLQKLVPYEDFDLEDNPHWIVE